MADGLSENGVLLVNSEHKPDIDTPAEVKNVDATRIALDTIGKLIFNTTMLGALAKLTQVVSIDALN